MTSSIEKGSDNQILNRSITRRKLIKFASCAAIAFTIDRMTGSIAEASHRKNPDRIKMITSEKASEIINYQADELWKNNINPDFLASLQIDLLPLTSEEVPLSAGNFIGNLTGFIYNPALENNSSSDNFPSQPLSVFVVLDISGRPLATVLTINRSEEPLPEFEDTPLQKPITEKDTMIAFANRILIVPEGIDWQKVTDSNFNPDGGKRLQGNFIKMDTWQNESISIVSGNDKPYLKISISKRVINKPIP